MGDSPTLPLGYFPSPNNDDNDNRFRNERRFYHGALILLLVLLFLKTCTPFLGGNAVVQYKGGDTLSVKTDEVTRLKYVIDSMAGERKAPVLKSETPVQQPVRKVAVKEQYNPKTNTTDTLWIFEPYPVDSAAIVAEALKNRYYETSYPVQYGKLTLKDSVSGNRLTWQDFLLEQNIPETIRNTTVTVAAPRRFQVYGMFEAMGNFTRPLGYVGGGLLFKTKNDQAFSAGVMLNAKEKDLLYKLGYYPLISFRKRK